MTKLIVAFRNFAKAPNKKDLQPYEVLYTNVYDNLQVKFFIML
jgi:hypothetical protein